MGTVSEINHRACSAGTLVDRAVLENSSTWPVRGPVDRRTPHTRGSVSGTAASGQRLEQALDRLPLESVVAAECHLADEPSLARPARHGVGRDTQELRHLEACQELRLPGPDVVQRTSHNPIG